jgi:molybdenum-dependent DNA-binding transcriptional regulator ModE
VLVAKRNELLEQRLIELRRGRMDAERAAAEQARRDLQLEIERERAAAAEAAERQRKELELEVDEDAGGSEAKPE